MHLTSPAYRNLFLVFCYQVLEFELKSPHELHTASSEWYKGTQMEFIES